MSGLAQPFALFFCTFVGGLYLQRKLTVVVPHRLINTYRRFMNIYRLSGRIASRFQRTILRLRYFKKMRKPLKLSGDLSAVPNLGTYVFRAAVHNRDNSRWALMADKYAARAEVARIIGSEHLIPLCGRWDAPEDIDFDALHGGYVLKTNNGCGTNVVVKDGDLIDRRQIVQSMRKSLDFPYAELSGQLHYSRIKPCIIAEKLMEQGGGHISLTDYKVHCVNGRACCVLVFTDRDAVHHFNYNLKPYTVKWQEIPEGCGLENVAADAPEAPDKPEGLDEMLQLAERLAQGEEYVRVDFYIIDGHIYFGEMTYTPDTLFNSHYDHLTKLMDGVLKRIVDDRRKGISKNTF